MSPTPPRSSVTSVFESSSSSLTHRRQPRRSSMHRTITDEMRQRLHKCNSGHIKRRMNAFILFRHQFSKEHRGATTDKNSIDLPKERRLNHFYKTVSQKWRLLSPTERKFWEDKAEERKKGCKQIHPIHKCMKDKRKGKNVAKQVIRHGLSTATPPSPPYQSASTLPTTQAQQLSLDLGCNTIQPGGSEILPGGDSNPDAIPPIMVGNSTPKAHPTEPTATPQPPPLVNLALTSPGNEPCLMSSPRTLGNTPKPFTMMDPVLRHLWNKLSDVLNSAEKRAAMWNLKGDGAQSVIDFLSSMLSCPQSSAPWLAKHAFIALYKLSKASNLYPRCYLLKNIKLGEIENGGGFCDIFKGYHEEQILCLKVLRLFTKGEKDAALQTLAKEAILWGHFDHPNIAPFYGVYYFDEARKRICLVSPWMDNGNLVAYLRQNPSVPRGPFIHDIAHGLEYLHGMEVVHGDLKGLNVLVNASGRACITDFGLSNVLTDKTLPFMNTTSSVLAHSVRWAAPELLFCSSPSRESDVWAFGCVCYEVLTRKPPLHEYNTDAQTIVAVITGGLPTRPSGDPRFDPDQINDEMWNLMNQCWNRDPGDRPTCKEITQWLNVEGPMRGRNDEIHDHVVQKRHRFQHAMVMNGDVLPDLDKVERILDEL